MVLGYFVDVPFRNSCQAALETCAVSLYLSAAGRKTEKKLECAPPFIPELSNQHQDDSLAHSERTIPKSNHSDCSFQVLEYY